jgi:GlpG protein
MADNAAPALRATEHTGADLAPAESTGTVTRPRISQILALACVGVFLGLACEDNPESWTALAKWGFLPADSIWRGAYWSLLSSVFVHLALWHVAFNAYWLWILGNRLEGAIGSLRFLAFVAAAAFLTSAYQLAVSDTTGMGASGVVYAMFGFMWPLRQRFPRFQEVLDRRTVNLFIGWLIGCTVATYLGLWNVGNAAHISGMLFGGIVGGYFIVHYKPRLMLACLGMFVVLAVVPLVWCPWSVTWLSIHAYDAHAAGRYDEALDLYTRILQRDPENAWAYANRGGVHEALGDRESAQADMEKARHLDPALN